MKKQGKPFVWLLSDQGANVKGGNTELQGPLRLLSTYVIWSQKLISICRFVKELNFLGDW